MAAKRKYTDEQFIEAVSSSISYREILNKLGLVEAGGNYYVLKRRIMEMNLDTSHIIGKAHLRGKHHNWSKAYPLSEILVENSLYGGGTCKLKNKIIKEGLLLPKCYECGLAEWRGKPLTLELEHKNGNRFDNRIENLSLLCPNCHSQTSTFRGKNKGSNTNKKCLVCQNPIDNRSFSGKCVQCVGDSIQATKNMPILKKNAVKRSRTRISKEHTCLDCRATVQRLSKRCPSCEHKRQRKAVRPTYDELLNFIKQYGYRGTGRIFGVSDNAIRKWLKTA
jgi:hypothetical protein